MIMECGVEDCAGEQAPIADDWSDKLGLGCPRVADEAKALRGSVIINYMAQNRQDMAVTDMVLSQRMASTDEGTKHCLKSAIRYLSSHARRLSLHSRRMFEEPLGIWIDSDWVGAVTSRKTCIGWFIQRSGGTNYRLRGTQANVARSTGEAALTSTAKRRRGEDRSSECNPGGPRRGSEHDLGCGSERLL